MTNEIFNEIVEDLINHCKDTLIRKGDEYSTEKDRLSNIRRMASLKGSSTAQATWDACIKHFASVMDQIESGVIPNEAWMNEKLGDIINYMLILKAVWLDSKAKK